MLVDYSTDMRLKLHVYVLKQATYHWYHVGNDACTVQCTSPVPWVNHKLMFRNIGVKHTCRILEFTTVKSFKDREGEFLRLTTPTLGCVTSVPMQIRIFCILAACKLG